MGDSNMSYMVEPTKMHHDERTTSHGGGENTGNVSSGLQTRASISFGDSKDIRCGSKYASSETVIKAEQGEGA